MPNQKPAPPANVLGQPHTSLFLRKTGGGGEAQSVCAVPYMHSSAEKAFQLLRPPGVQERKPPLASRTRELGDVPCMAAEKNQSTKCKNWVLDVCRSFPLEDTSTLGCRRWSVQMGSAGKKGKKKERERKIRKEKEKKKTKIQRKKPWCPVPFSKAEEEQATWRPTARGERWHIGKGKKR